MLCHLYSDLFRQQIIRFRQNRCRTPLSLFCPQIDHRFSVEQVNMMLVKGFQACGITVADSGKFQRTVQRQSYPVGSSGVFIVVQVAGSDAHKSQIFAELAAVQNRNAVDDLFLRRNGVQMRKLLLTLLL